MNTALFYFSGTGNSLFVARSLANKIEDCEILSIASFINDETVIIKAKKVGFVYPCHFGDMPSIVADFLDKLQLPHCEYAFAVVTRGNGKGYSIRNLQRKLAEKSIRLNFGESFRMQMTYIPASYYSAIYLNQRKERINEIRVIDKVKRIATSINGNKDKHDKSFFLEYLIERFINFKILKMNRNLLDHGFVVQKSCLKCGCCEKVCPVNNITYINNKPNWYHHCIHCMACVHFCSGNAIDYKRHTIGKKRYHNKNIGIQEMQLQKAAHQCAVVKSAP